MEAESKKILLTRPLIQIIHLVMWNVQISPILQNLYDTFSS